MRLPNRRCLSFYHHNTRVTSRAAWQGSEGLSESLNNFLNLDIYSCRAAHNPVDHSRWEKAGEGGPGRAKPLATVNWCTVPWAGIHSNCHKLTGADYHVLVVYYTEAWVKATSPGVPQSQVGPGTFEQCLTSRLFILNRCIFFFSIVRAQLIFIFSPLRIDFDQVCFGSLAVTWGTNANAVLSVSNSTSFMPHASNWAKCQCVRHYREHGHFLSSTHSSEGNNYSTRQDATDTAGGIRPKVNCVSSFICEMILHLRIL